MGWMRVIVGVLAREVEREWEGNGERGMKLCLERR